MSPRGCGRGRRRRRQCPIRGRGRGGGEESSHQEGSITRKDAAAPPQVVPPQAMPTPTARIDPTTSLMWESFQAMMHTMVATQQANSSQSTSGARYFRDFKRYDPRTFSGTERDPTEAHMWILNMETIFLLMECPNDQKVFYASFMLKKDAKLWWMDNKDNLNQDGGIITWPRFKEAFLKEFYPKVVRLKKQQEFNHLTQGGHSVDRYAREFMRLKRFAPFLVDTEQKNDREVFHGSRLRDRPHGGS